MKDKLQYHTGLTHNLYKFMKAFISYSHQDSAMLEILHKHLAQLKRDNVLSTWTDQEITPGGNLTKTINSALNSSAIFLALLSPDYIASNYCYEKEFQMALEMEKNGKIIIVPIILEPCDWLNTPFSVFKAIPKDGKPVSTWDNKNTAFLDVIQNIRRLTTSGVDNVVAESGSSTSGTQSSRNYRIKKDFDSIQKIEFASKSFVEVKDYLKRYLEEIGSLENIKSMILSDAAEGFDSILVNRNKINTESKLTLSTLVERTSFNRQASDKQINFTIDKDGYPLKKGFTLSFDDYHLFWAENNSYNFIDSKELSTKDMADIIWDMWLESVGIG